MFAGCLFHSSVTPFAIFVGWIVAAAGWDASGAVFCCDSGVGLIHGWGAYNALNASIRNFCDQETI